MTRPANFNAGPAALPESILETLRDELLNWQGLGLSVLEMSHRSPEFQDIAQQAEADVRTLLGVPDHYRVLFLQGGATAQFGLVVANLDVQGQAAFALTGHWSGKAQRIASMATNVSTVCELSASGGLRSIPPLDEWSLPGRDCSFLHLCDNETIDGVVFSNEMIAELSQRLEQSAVPLIADMSSSLFSRPIDVERYGLIYASAQKNFGLAGLTLVIARDDLIERSETRQLVSPVFSYAHMATADSMLNTPPTFAWYVAGVIFRWLLDRGGLEAMQTQNRRQAKRLYDVIDNSDCYRNSVHTPSRSIMNVPFQLRDEKTTKHFLDTATSAGLRGLKGHKSVGGARASVYNASTDAWVTELIDVMSDFATERM